MDKRARVVMLPTKEKAGLVINPSTNKIQYVDFEKNSKYYTEASFICNHLYITSDDEIKKGDWVFSKHYGIGKVTSNNHANYKGDFPLLVEFLNKPNHFVPYNTDGSYTSDRKKIYLQDCKKIIATTDISLTVKAEQAGENAWFNPLPQPSQSFIQKYVDEYNKGNIITDVMVKYEKYLIVTQDDLLDSQNKAPSVMLPKLSKDNTITIKKVKDSWSRDEVVKLIHKAFKAGYERSHSGYPNTDNHTKPKVDKWIKNNL